MTRDINSNQDILDVRDIIARVEELREERDELGETQGAEPDEDDAAELATLESLLNEMEGGDEQWEGSWYPATLVRDTYFKDHAIELAEDCGMVNADAHWPNNHIDWDAAADELKGDYSAVEYDGVTYWYR